MLDWTDRHCRYFHRQLSRQARLYTEMVTTGALLYGDRARFLAFDPIEHPLALQLGGSDPTALADCARHAEAAGYDEVNLNAGCPSDRVQNNLIGACLMKHPQRVADCLKAMQDAVDIEITIKHRIGINGHESYGELCDFVGHQQETGCKTFIVHARIAILEGLSPKENREVPPLQYAVVQNLKQDFPHLRIILNGGINNLDEAEQQLQGLDGVMLGRAAYQNPALLADVDPRLYGTERPTETLYQVLRNMLDYAEAEVGKGTTLHHVTRHILGLAHGFPGARRFRQMLSTDLHRAADPLQTFAEAIELFHGR